MRDGLLGLGGRPAAQRKGRIRSGGGGRGRWRLVEVAVDGGSGDAEFGGDLGDGPLVLAVGVKLVVHRPGEVGLPGSEFGLGSAHPAACPGGGQSVPGALAHQGVVDYLDKFGLSRGRRLAKVVEQLLEPVGGVLVSFDFSVPAAFDGVLDEGQFQLVALHEPRGVVTRGEEFGTGEHEVAFAGAFLWQAQAMSEFELGLEEVGLEPGNSLRVEAVIAQSFHCWAGHADVRTQVSVESVLVLLLDGGVRQTGVNQRHVRGPVPQHGHDRLQAGTAFGQLRTDGVPEAVCADHRPAVGIDETCGCACRFQ